MRGGVNNRSRCVGGGDISANSRDCVNKSVIFVGLSFTAHEDFLKSIIMWPNSFGPRLTSEWLKTWWRTRWTQVCWRILRLGKLPKLGTPGHRVHNKGAPRQASIYRIVWADAINKGDGSVVLGEGQRLVAAPASSD